MTQQFGVWCHTDRYALKSNRVFFQRYDVTEIDLVCKETRRRQRRGKRGDETVDIQAAKAASDAASIFSAVILPPGDITVSTLKWTSDTKSAMVLGRGLSRSTILYHNVVSTNSAIYNLSLMEDSTSSFCNLIKHFVKC